LSKPVILSTVKWKLNLHTYNPIVYRYKLSASGTFMTSDRTKLLIYSLNSTSLSLLEHFFSSLYCIAQKSGLKICILECLYLPHIKWNQSRCHPRSSCARHVDI